MNQINTPLIDYADSGLDIQYAMLDHFKRFPSKELRPEHILWGGKEINTGDVLEVPREGTVTCAFLSDATDVEQGFDLKVDGWIALPNGNRVKVLRTWNDSRYEPEVAYRYHAKDNQLKIWNVYKMTYRGGDVVEEKWTGNAGMWIERVSAFERIYHCSHGMAKPPDFESLIFRVSITGDEER